MTSYLVIGIALIVAVRAVPQPTVTLLKPQGIKFSIPDEQGTSLVAVHFNINAPLQGVEAGSFAADVRTKSGNEWIYEDHNAVVHLGDKVNYWIFQVKNGQGSQLTDQTWIAAGPTMPSPATAKPTTQTTLSPIVTSSQNHVNNSPGNSGTTTPATATTTPTTQMPIKVQTTLSPIVTSSKNPVNNSLDYSVDNYILSTGLNSQTSPPQTANVQMSSSVLSGGSCGCTGTSTKPPGSEKSCAVFPCMIFEDNFDKLDLDVWEHEITAGGGGNWEFNYYTNNRSNSYVRDGKLYIKPTLTEESLGEGPGGLTRGVLDLWGSQPGDICTSNDHWGCERGGTADHIINPVQSARLRSSRGFNFKYGKVEISAKMPTGDWLWPAIWMLPLRNAYGRWPASGEIDIVEARGNRQYSDDKGQPQGVENAGSTLHFGSDFWHNKWPTAHGEKTSSSGTYGDGFHKYVLIWDEDHISISIDDVEVLNVTPPTSMWEYGGNDQESVENPWVSGTKIAPFDQEFFLILNVAVGGIAFFPDKFHSPTGKPWNDKSQFAPRDFWNAKGQWYPTWNADTNNGEDAAMVVDYVRVWKLK